MIKKFILYSLFSICYFNLSSSFAVLLQDNELNQNNHVTVRVWNPSNLPYGKDGHVSIAIEENGIQQNYISIHKGGIHQVLNRNNTHTNGDFFDPVWGANLQDDNNRVGSSRDKTIKLFSLNRDRINTWFNNHRSQDNNITYQHIKYHPYGDTFTKENFCHNPSSLAVYLLKKGGIQELFPINQETWSDTLWVTTKCGILGAPIVAGGVIAGPALVTAATSAGITGTVIAGAGAVGGGVVEEAYLGAGRRAIREARAFIMDSYHEKKYGHPVFAPVGQNFSDRYFETTVHQFIDFIDKVKNKEKARYVATINW